MDFSSGHGVQFFPLAFFGVMHIFYRIRLILLGDRFFHNFQISEIIGDMYRYTEAFCHCSWNSPEAEQKTSSLNFTYFRKKIRKYGRLKNCARKMSTLWKKSYPIRMTLTRKITTTNPLGRRFSELGFPTTGRRAY